MARRRKNVEKKNYAELIKSSEEKITKLTQELKEEKEVLKKLKKDKAVYDKMIEEQAKEKEIREITTMIVESGKSLDEIKELLSK